MTTQVTLPLDSEQALALRCGQEVEISGWVLTGRDVACRKLFELLQSGQPLPIELRQEVMYFVGPSPALPGQVIGSAGPTTTGRMNRFLPALLDAGLRGMIGKGYIDETVKTALAKNQAVYFGAIGGTGALLSTAIAEVEVVAFEELLSEAVRRLRLVRFPAVVLHDAHGGDLYAQAAGSARHEN